MYSSIHATAPKRFALLAVMRDWSRCGRQSDRGTRRDFLSTSDSLRNNSGRGRSCSDGNPFQYVVTEAESA
jgi:hypothetical protein